MNRRLKYFIWDIQYYFNRRLCRDCYRRLWYGGYWDEYHRKVHHRCGEMRSLGLVPNDSIRRKSKWRFWD